MRYTRKKVPLFLCGAAIVIAAVFYQQREAVWFSKVMPGLVQRTLRALHPAALKEQRVYFIRTGWEAFKEKPLLGWGQENYLNAFLKYRNQDAVAYKLSYTIWIDRAHNIIIDTLVATGLVGLIAYLGIFGVIFFISFRLWRATRSKKIFVLASSFFAYFFQNLFTLDTPTSFLMFFFGIGLLNSVYQEQRSAQKIQNDDNRPITNNYNYVFALIVVAVMSIAVYRFNIIPFLSSRLTIIANATLPVDFRSGMYWYRKALLYSSPYLLETRVQLAKNILQQYASRLSDISDTTRDAPKTHLTSSDLSFAIDEMRKNIISDPLNIRYGIWFAQLANTYTSLYDDRYTKEVIERIEKYLKDGYESQYLYWELGRAKLHQGKKDEVAALYKKALDLDEGANESWWYLAYAYLVMEQYDRAIEPLDMLLARNYDFNQEDEPLLLVAEAFEKKERWQDAVNILLLYIKKHSDDVPANVRAFDYYRRLNDIDKGIPYLQKASELDPRLREKVEKIIDENGQNKK